MRLTATATLLIHSSAFNGRGTHSLDTGVLGGGGVWTHWRQGGREEGQTALPAFPPSICFSLPVCSSECVTDAVAWLSAGGMLEANVANISMTAKPSELDLRSAAVSCQETSAQAMASKKPPAKPSALPLGHSRASGSELKVYRPSSGSIPVPAPNPSRLRKQRSLNNLCVLTDAEKKLHLYQSPRWNDDAIRPGTDGNKPSQLKKVQAGGGRTPLCRTLSKSEQSLFQGKPKALCPPSVTPYGNKPSRIPAPGKPRGPYAEIKPISKAPVAGQNADTDPEDQPTKANSNGAGNAGTNGKKIGERERCGSLSTEETTDTKGMEGEEDKSFLKVDPELVVTVLGDLEQLLFSQMLGESAVLSLYAA